MTTWMTIGLIAVAVLCIILAYTPFTNAMMKRRKRDDIKNAKKSLECARKSYNEAHKYINFMHLWLNGTGETLESIGTSQEEIDRLIKLSNIARAQILLGELKGHKGGHRCAPAIHKLLQDVNATLDDISTNQEEIDGLHKTNCIREAEKLLEDTVRNFKERGLKLEEIIKIFKVFDPKKVK